MEDTDRTAAATIFTTAAEMVATNNLDTNRAKKVVITIVAPAMLVDNRTIVEAGDAEFGCELNSTHYRFDKNFLNTLLFSVPLKEMKLKNKSTSKRIANFRLFYLNSAAGEFSTW